MRKFGIIQYECEICKHIYQDEKAAISCESRKVSQDKGVKKDDIILITKGEGTGQKAKVSIVWIYDKYWGHYAYNRYWHTVGLSAQVIGSWVYRQLTFDDYEIIKDQT